MPCHDQCPAWLPLHPLPGDGVNLAALCCVVCLVTALLIVLFDGPRGLVLLAAFGAGVYFDDIRPEDVP